MTAEEGSNTEKPKLNRQRLRDHGIDFIEKPSNIDELDGWLRPIGRAITRLQKRTSEAEREMFEKQLKQFYLCGQDCDDARTEEWCLMPAEDPDYLQQGSYTDSEAECHQEKPARYSEALQAIRNCRARNESEIKWAQVLLEHVFWDFSKTNKGLGSYEQKLTGWELQPDVLWNEFPRWARMDPKRARVTQPKPDITYAFPVISPHDKAFRTLQGDARVDSFSLPVLAELRSRQKDSIISAPTTAMYNLAAKNKAKLLEAKDLMCFPWAIVEVKRGTTGPSADVEHRVNKAEAKDHKKRAEFCYCQAANASAAGLTLRERLATTAKDRSKLREARVMFSFTCVGSAVKLWITYRKKPEKCSRKSQPRPKEGRIVMVCIWATSLELSCGIMALRTIVKNMIEWVNANIKPEVARWINDAHQKRLLTHSLTPSGDTAVYRRRATSCGPTNEVVEVEDSPTPRSRYSTPRGKSRPTIAHFETAPVSRSRRWPQISVPEIQLNGSIDSDNGEVDDGSDEGYASVYDRRRKILDDKEDCLSEFIVNDELSDDNSDASYEPSTSEDESTGSESAESEEGDDDDTSGSEDYDLSDGDRHCHSPNYKSRVYSKLESYCTPTKVRSLSRPQKGKLKKDRRRSSRF